MELKRTVIREKFLQKNITEWGDWRFEENVMWEDNLSAGGKLFYKGRIMGWAYPSGVFHPYFVTDMICDHSHMQSILKLLTESDHFLTKLYPGYRDGNAEGLHHEIDMDGENREDK